MIPPELPDELAGLVDAFADVAQGYGWHRKETSEGKCWLISIWFAWYAVEYWGIEPGRVACREVSNRHATRTADGNINFVVIDGWAFDWTSQGHAPGRPWPDIEPELEKIARYGGHINQNMCPACGFSRPSWDASKTCPFPECPGHDHPHRLRDKYLPTITGVPDVKHRRRAVAWMIFDPTLTMTQMRRGQFRVPGWALG